MIHCGMNINRTISTGLLGSTNHEILNSIIGQLSDGKWENTPSMRKYWENAQIGMRNGEVVIHIADGYGSGFNDKDDARVMEFFAGKIKNVAQDELEGAYRDIMGWNRMNTATKLDYLGSTANPVTAADAYRAYDTLKGRDAKKLAKTAQGKIARFAALTLKDAEIAAAEAVVLKLRAERAKL